MSNQSVQSKQSQNEQMAATLRKSGLPVIVKDGKVIIGNKVNK